MRFSSWLMSLVVLFACPALAAEPDSLVDVAWVKANAGRDDVVLLDIRSRVDGGSAKTFAAGHIPGAVYSNYLEAGWRTEIDGVVGQAPKAEQLEKLIGQLGIDNDSTVVIISAGVSSGDFGSAARIYWTFNYVGHDKVAILDGGYRAWTADASNPIETGAPLEPEPRVFKVSLRPELVVDGAAVEAALNNDDILLLDGRPDEQFQGKARHAGHIPGAIQLDHATTFDAKTGKLIDVAELEALLPAGLEMGDDKEVLNYCNTGHQASVNWFVLSEVLGKKNIKLYDGSMADWTRDPSHPVAN